MVENPLSAAIVGCTGLVGTHILTSLLASPSHPTVHAFSRRALKSSPENLKPHISSDSYLWPHNLKTLTPIPGVFFSALATTRGQVGSFEAQYAIEHDLNLSLARAAKESDVGVYVLISSGASSTKSWYPYLKMKGSLEEEVKKLEFPYTVIIKPGLLMGEREDRRPLEAVLQGLANAMGAISGGYLRDFWAQDAKVVGDATVVAAMMCLEGKRQNGVWVVEQSEIMKLSQMK